MPSQSKPVHAPPPAAPRATVAQRIANALPRLTRAHRRMADHVLAHPLQVATQPIDELAASMGLSVATANRFARALQYEGYAEFRAELVRGFEPILAPVERLRGQLAQPSTVAEVFAGALEEIHRNIEATRQSLDARQCEEAVRRVLAARRVFVLGWGASAWLAGLLQHGLESHCQDVRLLATPTGITQAARVLAQAGERDLLVALAFPRYLDDTVTLTREARERGLQVLAITDKPSSPLAPLADVALYAQTATRYRATCDSCALALIEALISAVVLRAPGAVATAQQVLEAVGPWLHGGQRLRARSGARRASNKESS